MFVKNHVYCMKVPSIIIIFCSLIYFVVAPINKNHLWKFQLSNYNDDIRTESETEGQTSKGCDPVVKSAFSKGLLAFNYISM